jgi:Family of unknown function (DUF6295)
MCSYIVEKAALVGSAKGRKGWMRIDTANVYFDHPYHSTLDHVLAIDFTNEGEGGRDRVAIELRVPIPLALWWNASLQHSPAGRRHTPSQRPQQCRGH